MLKSFRPVILFAGTCAETFVISQDVAALESKQLLDDIRDAWSRRSRAVRSFRYEYVLVETKPRALSPDATDVFGRIADGGPTLDISTKRNNSYSCSDGKIAFRSRGEQWYESKAEIIETTIEVVFDGKMYKTLMQAAPAGRPHGILDESESATNMLTNLSDAAVFWLAFNPELYLDRTGYDHKKMTIEQPETFRAGQKCVELLVSRRSRPDKESPWSSELYVDSTRDYLPIQFIRRKRGAIVSQLDIEYKRHNEVGWVVSAWRETRFDSNGRAKSSKQGVVDDAKVKC